MKNADWIDIVDEYKYGDRDKAIQEVIRRHRPLIESLTYKYHAVVDRDDIEAECYYWIVYAVDYTIDKPEWIGKTIHTLLPGRIWYHVTSKHKIDPSNNMFLMNLYESVHWSADEWIDVCNLFTDEEKKIYATMLFDRRIVNIMEQHNLTFKRAYKKICSINKKIEEYMNE